MGLLGGLCISHPSAHYHINDDGGTDEWGYGVERYDARLTRHGGDEVAHEGNGGSADDGQRQERLVVVAVEEQSGDVWNCKPYERYRTAIGGGDGGEQTGGDKQQIACATYVDTQVFSVLRTEQKCIEWFYQQYRHQQSGKA